MKKYYLLIAIVSAMCTLNAQHIMKANKYLSINISQSVYSFDKYSYKRSYSPNVINMVNFITSADKFIFNSKFNPKIGLEFSFGNNKKITHGISINYYTYEFFYYIECPNMLINSYPYNDIISYGNPEILKIKNLSLDYRFYYKLNDKYNLSATIGIEDSGLRTRSPFLNGTYYAMQSPYQKQSYRRYTKQHFGEQKSYNFFIFSINGSYKLNNKIYINLSIETKPFSNIYDEYIIKYDEDIVDELTVQVLNRYIILSTGFKYCIPLSKEKHSND